jgi:hypothetical protein
LFLFKKIVFIRLFDKRIKEWSFSTHDIFVLHFFVTTTVTLRAMLVTLDVTHN